MHALVILSHLSGWMPAIPHFFAEADGIWDTLAHYTEGSHSASMREWKRTLEVIFSILCLLCALGLFIFYSLAHRQMRKENKHLLRKRSLWTNDQINACVLPLGIGVLFAVIFYLFR